MLSLAVEAIKVEIEHWRNPGPPGAPVVEAAAAPAKSVVDSSTSKWASSAFHMQVLDSTECPDCGGAKKLKSYRCGPCHQNAVAQAGGLRAAG